MSVSASAGRRRVRRNLLRRAALAIPLLYMLLVCLEYRPRSASLVVGVVRLWFPAAIMGLALVILLVGSANRTLWRVVCGGGFVVAAYGVCLDVVWASGPPGGRIDYLNEYLAFGLYAAFLGLLQGWGLANRREVRGPLRT